MKGQRKPKPKPAPAPTKVEPPSPIDGLHARGRGLWTALGQDLNSPAGQLALEICRTADRLDELDKVIAGDGVLNLMQFRTRGNPWWDSDGEQHVHIEVGFQSVLAEARQQQLAFRALLVELGLKAAPAKPAVPAPRSPLDELRARRQGAS